MRADKRISNSVKKTKNYGRPACSDEPLTTSLVVCEDEVPVSVECSEIVIHPYNETGPHTVVIEDKPLPVEMATQTCDTIPEEVEHFYASHFKDNPKGMQFYRGLDHYDHFCDVLSSLGPAAFHLWYLNRCPTINVENQFF